MNDFLMWAGGVIISGLFGLIGWVFTMIFGALKEHGEKHNVLESRLEAHRLYAAESFTTKLDISKIEDKIVRQLDRIEEKLDKKADKGSGRD